MANMAQTSATKVPARSTDLRERNVSGLIQSTAVPGSNSGHDAITSANMELMRSLGKVPGPGVANQGNTGATVGGQMVGNQITAENSLRDKRLDFNVGSHQASGPGGFERVKSKKTTGAISAAFKAQQPQMMQQFKDESRALVQRTAAMGRTGSGLFNRDTGFVGDRALQAREALLGNLSFQATQADANRALQASLGNQSAGVSMAGIGAQISAGNASRAMQADILRQQHAQGLQAREDMMANQAMQQANLQAMLLGQGFQGAPTGAAGQHANNANNAASQYGANAGQLGDQAGAAANQVAQSYGSQGGPTAPGPSRVVLPKMNFPKPKMPGLTPDRPNFSREDMGF